MMLLSINKCCNGVNCILYNNVSFLVFSSLSLVVFVFLVKSGFLRESCVFYMFEACFWLVLLKANMITT